MVDEQGQLIHQGETPTLVGRPYRGRSSRTWAVSALKVLERGQADGGSTFTPALGIGIPGIADAKTGNVIFCTNMGWKDVPLRSELQKYINKPVFIDNDATVAGFAESVAGVSKGTSSSVFLTLGTGVGGGIVINGRPWSGFHGVGSEIGHIPMDIGGVPCTCGNEGCLERYCSATAIIRMGKQILQQHPESMMMEMVGGDPEKLTAKIVFDAARELDNAAMKVFTTYVDYLAKACYTIIAFLDPEVIVLGGGVSKAGSFLLDAVRARVPKYLLFKTLPYSRIELARLGADAGMIGAAMLGRQA